MAILLIVLTVNTVSLAVKKKDDSTNIIVEQGVSDTNIYKDLNLSIENKESTNFTSSIMIPKTNIEAVDKKINNWVNETENEFYKTINKKNDELNENFRAHLNIQTEVLEVTDDLVSILLNVYEFTGGANGENTIEPFIVNLKEGTLVQINDLFNFKQLKDKNHLYKLVDSELRKDNEIYKHIDHELLKTALHKNKDLTWSINSSNFSLHFQEYEVGPGSIGALTVDIPVEKFDKYIDKQLAEELNVKEKVLAAKEKENLRKKDIIEKKIQEERKKNLKDLDPNKKYVAITFDDGPSSDITPRILDYLDQYNAVATFYMLGKQAKANPEIAKNVADRGHEIASHSVTHVDLSAVSANRVKKEYEDAISMIKQATGVSPNTFRPPYGAINQNVLTSAKEFNQPIILWSVDSLDWKHRSKDGIYSRVMNNMHSGAIVLLHDIHPTTADSLPSILSTLTNQGYEFVTVTELLQLTGEEDIGPYNSKK